MSLTLQTPDVSAVKFRADLPAWMGAGLFIEIDGRPSGRVNQAFMAGQERVNLAKRIRDARVDAITDPGDLVKAKDESGADFGRDWFGMVYDACIIAWRTNLVDNATGKPLDCDRETFLALTGVRMFEIARAITDFQAAIHEAGEAVLADTAATIKN